MSVHPIVVRVGHSVGVERRLRDHSPHDDPGALLRREITNFGTEESRSLGRPNDTIADLGDPKPLILVAIPGELEAEHGTLGQLRSIVAREQREQLHLFRRAAHRDHRVAWPAWLAWAATNIGDEPCVRRSDLTLANTRYRDLELSPQTEHPMTCALVGGVAHPLAELGMELLVQAIAISSSVARVEAGEYLSVRNVVTWTDEYLLECARLAADERYSVARANDADASAVLIDLGEREQQWGENQQGHDEPPRRRYPSRRHADQVAACETCVVVCEGLVTKW